MLVWEIISKETISNLLLQLTGFAQSYTKSHY